MTNHRVMNELAGLSIAFKDIEKAKAEAGLLAWFELGFSIGKKPSHVWRSALAELIGAELAESFRLGTELGRSPMP